MTLQTFTDTSIINALRRKGFKATSQRIAICQSALASREHPTAKRIFTEVKKTYPTVSLATVYKTLQVLKELHLVQELAFPQRESRFDSLVEPHLNVVCLRCGKVVDVNDRSARSLVLKAAEKTRYTVTEQRFDIYGFCEKCKTRRKLTLQR
jgi:Fur family peroxide stress response transcriptional regulator